MNQKLILGIVLLIAIGGFALLFTDGNKNEIACTMEAKICPDGSSLGRTGPNCEFASCPGEGGGNGDGGGGILPYRSGINGAVFRGPMCPVMRVDEPCPDAPYATVVTLYRANTSFVFASIKSDAQGKFQFNIPSGDYVVNAVNEGISKTCGDVHVTVGPDTVENITISCDTGIR